MAYDKFWDLDGDGELNNFEENLMWEDLDHELNGKHDDDDLTEDESYDEYDEGYEDVIYEDEYDEDRYELDEEYAMGVDDALEELNDSSDELDELDENDGASEHNYFNNNFDSMTQIINRPLKDDNITNSTEYNDEYVKENSRKEEDNKSIKEESSIKKVGKILLMALGGIALLFLIVAIFGKASTLVIVGVLLLLIYIWKR